MRKIEPNFVDATADNRIQTFCSILGVTNLSRRAVLLDVKQVGDRI